MHPSTIDWLRPIHLNADSALAKKRTELAKKLSEEITQKDVIAYLRAFLFPTAAQELAETLTQKFKDKDVEFPGTDNVQDVRLGSVNE